MESLAVSLIIGLIAHFVGDYILQTHWMATLKTTQWLPAIAHGVTYTLPFLFATQSIPALLVICVTHILIDRFRLAKYLVWFKNQFAPSAYRPRWKRPSLAFYKTELQTHTYQPENPFGPAVSIYVQSKPSKNSITAATVFYAPADSYPTDTHATPESIAAFKEIRKKASLPDSMVANQNTGMPLSTPAWMGVWLMIIADNTVHVVINSLAIWISRW